MFGTLLASGAARLPITRPAIAAGILHLLVVIAAARLTASASSAPPVVRRDTIALQLANPTDPTSSAGGSLPPTPLAPPPPPLTEASPVPRIDLASPYRAFDWSGLMRVEPPAGTIGVGPTADSARVRFSTEEVDQLPELRGTMKPLYPGRLKHAGISGSVQVEYVILPNGRADSASLLVIDSTEPEFTTSVIKALLGASFKPARRQGRPVAVLVQQTIRFQNR
jgi:TonB family protein